MKRSFIKSFFPLLTLIVIIAVISSIVGKKGSAIKRTRFLMGTIVEITVFNSGKEPGIQEAIEGAFREIKRLEDMFGRRQSGSDVWKVNHSFGKDVKVSSETMDLIRAGLYFSKLSGGAFDITVGRLMELWNFEGDRRVPPSAPEIKNALSMSGSNNMLIDAEKNVISADNGVHLDLGGIAKGYIIDLAAAKLLERGIKNFIINAGGDMVIWGRKGNRAWKIGLQNPRDSQKIMAHMEVDEAHTAIVTSGDYERFFIHDGVRYHHIIDPSSGYPARGLISVTITAEDAKTADALSTAVFVLGVEKGLKLIDSLEGVEGMLVDEAQKIHLSKGIKEKVVVL